MSLLKQAFFVGFIVILSHSNFSSLQSEEEKTPKDNTLDNSVPTTAKRVLKLGIENDVILLSDREYTHGTRLEYGQYEFLHSPSAWIFLGLKKLIVENKHIFIKKICNISRFNIFCTTCKKNDQ